MFRSSKIGGEKVLGVFSELSSLEGEKCSEDVSNGSLYTLLNFENMQHFEDEISEVLGEKFWLMLVDYFSAGMQEPTRGKIVLKVVSKIISSQDKGPFSIVASGNEPLSKEKEIEKVIRVLEKISPQEAFRGLKEVKKGVEDTLNECQGDVLTNEDYSKQILRYLQDLEKCSKNTTGPIIEGFLSDRIDSFGELTDELLTKMKDAVLILRDDELRYFYNREVERELPPMVSYAQCKTQYDTANSKIMQSHVIVAGQKPAEVNVEKAVEVQTITNKSSKEGGKMTLYDLFIGSGRKKGFDGKLFGPFRKQIWTEVVSCLAAGLKEPTRFPAVANAVNQIIEKQKKSSNPALPLSRENLSEEGLEKAIKSLGSLKPKWAFKELQTLRSQAKGILDSNRERVIAHQDAFEQSLQYLEDLERWLRAEKKPVIDKFLSNNSSFLFGLSHELLPIVSKTMSTIWDDELRCFLEVEGKLDLNNLSVSGSVSAGNELSSVEPDVNANNQATCSQPVQEDSGVNSKGCSEDDEGFYDAKQYKGKGHDLSGEVTLIKKEGSQQLGNQLVDLAEEKNPLEEKLNNIQQDLDAKTKEFEYTKARLEEKLDKTTEEFERKEADLKNCKKELDNVNAKVSKLELEKLNQQESINGLNKERNQLASKINTLTEEVDRIKTQLEKSKVELKQAKQDASTLEDKVAQLTEENTELKNELSGKNEKFLLAGTSSKRQGNYASVSFTLSGAFAVCASLAVFHLAICISLGVAALTLFAVGCHFSYRANTALSCVEVDRVENCVNSTASGTQVVQVRKGEELSLWLI